MNSFFLPIYHVVSVCLLLFPLGGPSLGETTLPIENPSTAMPALNLSPPELEDQPNFVRATDVILQGLDKVTTRVLELKGAVGAKIQFGTLEIVAQACYRTPLDETHESAVYVTIYDRPKGRATQQIFSGWMFASSPGLSPFAHPVYDVWLKECHLPGPNAKPAP
jgi:hypothetical protein